ncbi:hypothetical protein FHT71_000864 [Rhizobium sp. BK060]|nr:hypothetical protein [Rhizobium sp. BK060]
MTGIRQRLVFIEVAIAGRVEFVEAAPRSLS